MKDLQKLTGLDVKLDKNKLVYDDKQISSAVAWEKDFQFAKYVYSDQSVNEGETYFGIRYSENNKDENLFISKDFMVDLTVINPGKIGKEFVKTVGHYHQDKPGTNIAYPEVYEDITGNIEYLLQSEPDKEGKVEVIWVVTNPGDKVVMPPGYGHVGMNVGSEPVVEMDIQKRDNPNGSDYSLFKEKVGGAFYRTEEGLVKNPNYEVSSLRIVRPLERPDWGLVKNKPLYISFIEEPNKFDWLINPEKYDFSLDGLFTDIEL